MTNEEKMTPEEAIAEISFLKVAVNKVMEQALDMAIKALSSWEEYSDKLWKKAYERGKTEALSQEPCDDAISRQAVINAIENDCMKGGLGSCFACYNDAQAFRGEIEKLPSVTQKSGKWIYKDRYYHDTITAECSECHREVEIPTCMEELMYKFCPYCSAKMESEGDA